MSDQIWSWVLGLVGVAGFVLAGRKVWWAWHINVAAQALWTTYAIVTEQYGFLVSAAVYVVVFSRNAARWTREHHADLASRRQRDHESEDSEGVRDE